MKSLDKSEREGGIGVLGLTDNVMTRKYMPVKYKFVTFILFNLRIVTKKLPNYRVITIYPP